MLLALVVTGSSLNGTTNVTGTLRWSGEVPGLGFTTLHGSVDSVEQQIFSLNASLRENYVLENPYMNPTPQSVNETMMSVSNFSYSYKSASGISLERRDEVNQGVSVDQGYGDTHWYCGNFATGSCKSTVPVFSLASLEWYGAVVVMATWPRSTSGKDVSTWEPWTPNRLTDEEAYEAIARLNAPGGVTGGYWSVPAAQAVSSLVPTCARLVCAVENGQLAHTAVYVSEIRPGHHKGKMMQSAS